MARNRKKAAEQTAGRADTGAETWTTVSVEFRAGAHVLRAEIPVPEGPVAPQHLLPAFQRLSDAIVDATTEAAQAAGRRVTCRAGCGACCRQLVPISAPEARHIRDLVLNLPPDRRASVLTRFADARRRLAASGVLDKLLMPETFTVDELRALGTEYFRLGMPCPFLDDESCSIHADRPLACREYLVTSPAANCADPAKPGVEGLMLPAKVSSALIQIEPARVGSRAQWVSLVIAPEWADAHPAQPPVRTGPEILRAVFSRLARREVVPDECCAAEPDGES